MAKTAPQKKKSQTRTSSERAAVAASSGGSARLVPKKDRNLEASNERFALVARLAAHSTVEAATPIASGNTISVTVQNVSEHDCTGGVVLLRCNSTGEARQTNFGPISTGRERTNFVTMINFPDKIGWSFGSDDGVGWGPGDITYLGGTSSVTLPLSS